MPPFPGSCLLRCCTIVRILETVQCDSPVLLQLHRTVWKINVLFKDASTDLMDTQTCRSPITLNHLTQVSPSIRPPCVSKRSESHYNSPANLYFLLQVAGDIIAPIYSSLLNSP